MVGDRSSAGPELFSAGRPRPGIVFWRSSAVRNCFPQVVRGPDGPAGGHRKQTAPRKHTASTSQAHRKHMRRCRESITDNLRENKEFSQKTKLRYRKTEIQQERLQKSSRSTEKVIPGASACEKYAANCGLAPRRASVDGSPGASACEKYAAECGLAPRRASLCSLDIIAVRRKSCYTIPTPPQYVVRMRRSVHYRYTCNDHLYSFRTSHGTYFADVAAVGLQQR